MQYIIESSKSIETLSKDLEKNITEQGFGILHIHNLEETMSKKGVVLGEACKIYEICNPKLAKEVLSGDMDMNMLLPCRISIYTDKGVTKIGMISPTSLMQESSHAKELLDVTQIVENKTKAIIDSSK